MKFKIAAFGMMVLFSFSTAQAASVTLYNNEAAFISSIGAVHTLVNFDTDSNGDPIAINTTIDQQYLSVGVDFNPYNGGVPIAFNQYPLSLPNNLQTVVNSAGGGGFEAVFTNPVMGVGLQVGDLQGPFYGDTILEIFDSSNTSLGSYNLFDTLGDGASTYLFFGVTSDVAISRLQVSIGARDYVYFDDFRFQPVPLPPALWLFGAGLLGLLSLGKRKLYQS